MLYIQKKFCFMEKQAILEKTILNMSRLPEWRIKEVSDFVAFLLQKNEDKKLLETFRKYASKSEAFNFLKEEEDLYSDEDLAEKF